MEAVILGAQAEDPGQRRLAERVLAEGVLNRRHACVGRKKAFDVAAREEQRANDIGPKVGEAGNEFRRPYIYSFPERGPGAALGTEIVCLGPGACLRPG